MMINLYEKNTEKDVWLKIDHNVNEEKQWPMHKTQGYGSQRDRVQKLRLNIIG